MTRYERALKNADPKILKAIQQDKERRLGTSRYTKLATLSLRKVAPALLEAIRVESAYQGLSMAAYVRQGLTRQVKHDQRERRRQGDESLSLSGPPVISDEPPVS